MKTEAELEQELDDIFDDLDDCEDVAEVEVPVNDDTEKKIINCMIEAVRRVEEERPVTFAIEDFTTGMRLVVQVHAFPVMNENDVVH